MSTIERVHELVDRLPEERLKDIILMFSQFAKPYSSPKNGSGISDKEIDQAERDAAFDYIMSLRNSIPVMDVKEELQKCREERYGI